MLPHARRVREYLEDFTFKACDLWDGEKIWRETVKTSQTTKAFNSFLFQENLMPRPGRR